ncbi:MAG: hypothetical protein J6M62_01130 [Selenomonadaceae bacterium]|nr:hypothetical protein [Selenomonadaceae bacterium]MBP3722838.1 hypothetical protein [Selenomonadaceae bacterium]
MIAEREKAYSLIDSMSDDKILLVIDILEALKKNEEFSSTKVKRTTSFDFTQYIGHGKKLFKNTKAIDEYIKESRNDRL